MKKLLVVFVFFGLVSCTLIDPPEFIGVEEVALQKFDGKEIEIVASLTFLNPNNLGGNLKYDAIEVVVNDLNAGVINSEFFEIPPKKEFSVPMVTKIKYDDLFKSDRKNILKNILNVVLEKKINIKFQGNVVYKLGSLSYNYPLNYSDTLFLKTKR